MNLFSKKYLSSFVVLVVLFSNSIGVVEARSSKGFSVREKKSETISRGDFIKMSIDSLDIPLVDPLQSMRLRFKDVPKYLTLYIKTAQKENALRVFGRSLHPTKKITRGEAVRLLSELLDVRSAKKINFRDIRKGSMEEKAVQVAMEHGWITPLRSTYFGANRHLKKDEAISMLQRISGKSPESNSKMNVPTFKVNLEGKSLNGSRATGFQSTMPKADILEAVWRMMISEYNYPEKIDEEEAAYRAIEALVDSADDEYTKFLRPKKAKNFQTQIKGKISGIGAQVEDKDGVVTVVTPLVGSPAEKAGIKPNDQIVAVDGESIEELDFMDAVTMIRGPEGSSVELTIIRNGSRVKISVVRGVVKVPEIEIIWHSNVAVIKLMQFGKLTETDLRGEVQKIMEKDPRGVILDVRNNPGGLLNAAEKVVGNFLPKGSEYAEIVSKGKSESRHTTEQPVALDVPLVVLINEGSASASEIVAGALKDHERAKLVGKKTFGKGTVQQVVQFKDGSNLKMTIAEWFTPDSIKIDGEGVHPDFIAEFSDERDAQLLKALDLLR